MNEKGLDERGRLSTQEKLAELAPGFGRRVGVATKALSDLASAAQAMGLGHNQLRRIIQEKAVPSFPAIAMLARKSGYRLEWLAMGQPPERSADLGSPPAAMHEEFAYIPRYDIRAGAGAGQIIATESVKGFLAFREDWVRQRLRRNPRNLIVVEIIGDSMEPTLSSGDIALVDISEERVRANAIYFVRWGSEGMVKRVELQMDGSLLLKSDNDRYEPQVVSAKDATDFRALGLVIWSGGLV